MRVLGIDPGYDRCGVAIVATSSNPAHDAVVLFSTCIETDRGASFDERLFAVVVGIEKSIVAHSPTHCVLEGLFFSANKTTALKVAEVRGALRVLARQHNLPVHEYSPAEIKMALTGSGNATKDVVARMVRMRSDVGERSARDDEFDALAIAITGLVSLGASRR